MFLSLLPDPGATELYMLKRNRLSLCVSAALSSLLVAAPSMAQDAKAPQQLERVEVTGSNIKRLDAEGLQPVVTLRRSDIERSGKTTVADLLASIPAVNGGSFSEASLAGNSFAPGTAAVSLRGLGVNTTLTLLNGRRIANYGFAQNINEGFVDLNSIPVSAIERIEILKDGASAVYGSDAIAGVVNVILRKDFTGVEGFASFGTTQQGGGDEKRAAITAGIGQPGKFNVTATFDFLQRDTLASGDRDFSRTADKRGQGPGGRDVRSPTGNPGYFFGGAGNVNTPFSNCPASSIVSAATLGAGSGNVCAYDFAPANKLLPDSRRVGALMSATLNLTPDIEVFGEVLLNTNTTGRYAAATPAAFALAATHPDRPAGSTFTSLAYRFLEIGDRLNTLRTESTRYVGGFRTSVAGFDIEAAAVIGRSDTEDVGRNYIIQERATQAFAGTLPGLTGQFYRVINPSQNSQAIRDAITIDPRRVGKSGVDSVDIKFSRDLFEMGGGMAAVAGGLETRTESVADTPDPRVDLTNPNRITVAGSGGTSVRGSRSLNSGYVEVSLPFAKGFESQLAIRTDDYSDFGRATTPKIGLSFRPIKQFLVRGGYAEGFRAPSLAEVYLGESTSFPTVVDGPRCADYRAGPLGANDPRTLAACNGATGAGASAQVRSIFLGNRNLTPEKSKSYSFGFVVEPIPSFVIAVDAYKIDHTNRILAPTAAFILANEALFPGAVTRGARTADDIAANARGNLRGVSGDLTPGIVRTFFNASKQTTSGADLDLRYALNMGDLGRLSATTSFSYVKSLKRQINPGQALVELIGSYQFPKLRNTTSFTWSLPDWVVTTSVTSIGSYTDQNSVSGVFPKVERFTTVDAQVAYSGFKNLTLTLGGRNIADKNPPFSNSDWYGYDASTHDPKGAYWYAKAGFKF
jgi:iron complex outermembrane recepter protein